MAHIIHHSYEESWPRVFFKAAIIALAVVALAAVYVAYSGSGTTVVTEVVPPPVLPPMFPTIPLL